MLNFFFFLAYFAIVLIFSISCPILTLLNHLIISWIFFFLLHCFISLSVLDNLHPHYRHVLRDTIANDSQFTPLMAV